MIVPCNCFLLLELYANAVLALTFWSMAEFTAFFAALVCQKNWTHSMPSAFGFLHNCSKAEYFQATSTPLISTQYVCISFRYQPFLLNIVLPFCFPKKETETSSKILLCYYLGI